MPKASTAFLSAVLIALAATAPAQDADPSPAAPETLSGQVMVVQGDSLFIATETGEERAFVMDTNVTVPAEASPGRRVIVTYRNPGGARAFATKVRLDDDEPPLAQLPRAGGRGPLLALLGLAALAGSALVRAYTGRWTSR
jgi:hypothetical protein